MTLMSQNSTPAKSYVQVLGELVHKPIPTRAL